MRRRHVVRGSSYQIWYITQRLAWAIFSVRVVYRIVTQIVKTDTTVFDNVVGTVSLPDADDIYSEQSFFRDEETSRRKILTLFGVQDLTHNFLLRLIDGSN